MSEQSDLRPAEREHTPVRGQSPMLEGGSQAASMRMLR